MATQYTCSTCGVVSTGKRHLCQPQEQTDNQHCGSTPTQAVNMCKSVDAAADYTCGGCGRTTTDPDLVCQPEKR